MQACRGLAHLLADSSFRRRPAPTRNPLIFELAHKVHENHVLCVRQAYM